MRRALCGATMGQLLLLPVLAALLIWLLRPSPAVAGGLLLVAVSPGVGMSNYYCALARLNVAFSVSLTTVSGFVALATMPLLFVAVIPVVIGVDAFGVPVGEMMSRLLLFVLLPVAAGMTLRRLYPAAIEGAGARIRGCGLSLLVVLLGLILLEERIAVTTIAAEIRGFRRLPPTGPGPCPTPRLAAVLEAPASGRPHRPPRLTSKSYT